MILDLSPEAIRNGSTTVPAPKVTWVKTESMRYTVKVDGATYLLAKNGRGRDAFWYLSKMSNQAQVRRGEATPWWNAVKVNGVGTTSFGRTLRTAKINAAMHLVRGATPGRSDWLFD